MLRASAAAWMLLTVALGGGGCGRRAPAGGGAAAPLVLEFWDFPHLPATAAHIQKTVAAFEAEHPGVRVRSTRLPWLDGQQKVVLAVLGGRPPDLCGQVNVSPQFLAQDVLEPLDADLVPYRADLHPDYVEAVSWRGQAWAVPWYKACYVALLNLDVFEARGVAPPQDGRWTWAEFLTKMKALTGGAAPGGILARGRTWGLATNLGPGEHEAYSVVFNAGGRVLSRDGTGRIAPTVNGARFIEGLRRLQSLDFEHGVCIGPIGATTQEQSWAAWRDTRAVGCTFQGGWCIAAVRQLNAGIERANAAKRAAGRMGELAPLIRWAIAAPPNDEGTTPVLGSSGLGTYVVFRQPAGRTEPARRRALAAELALRIALSPAGQAVLRDENTYPSRRSAGNPYADDPALGPVFALFPAGVMNPLVPGAERLDRVLQNEIQRALLRGADGRPQATAEAAAAAAQANVEAVLARSARRLAESAP